MLLILVVCKAEILYTHSKFQFCHLSLGTDRQPERIVQMTIRPVKTGQIKFRRGGMPQNPLRKAVTFLFKPIQLISNESTEIVPLFLCLTLDKRNTCDIYSYFLMRNWNIRFRIQTVHVFMTPQKLWQKNYFSQ